MRWQTKKLTLDDLQALAELVPGMDTTGLKTKDDYRKALYAAADEQGYLN